MDTDARQGRINVCVVVIHRLRGRCRESGLSAHRKINGRYLNDTRCNVDFRKVGKSDISPTRFSSYHCWASVSSLKLKYARYVNVPPSQPIDLLEVGGGSRGKMHGARDRQDTFTQPHVHSKIQIQIHCPL